MTRKENALRIIHFNKPQKVIEQLPVYRLEYHGCGHQGFGHDLGHHSPVGTHWKDIWGTIWHKEQAGVMGFPKEYPLADPKNFKDYEWPDPNDERICGKIYRMHQDFPGGDLFLGGYNRDLLWEKSHMLVGMENMMTYFHTEPEYAKEILHRIMDFQLGIAQHYIKLGIEIVFYAEDLGSQSSLLHGPDLIRDFLMPEYRRIFDLYKPRGILSNFHSCGHIEPAIAFFLELGVDILNPVQATANDLRKVRSMTQGRIALQGAISSKLVMEGPVEQIRADVKDKIQLLGKEGGYICQPDQGLPYPPAHMDALKQAVEEFGVYSL